MTGYVGSPPILPDNITIDQNVSTGKLETKPGGVPLTALAKTTQGAVLYDNGTNIVELNPGTSGQVLQTNGANQNPSWGTVNSLDWSLLQTLTPSAVSSITSAALTACTAYRVVMLLKASNGTATNLSLQFNGDAGANYGYYFFNATGPAVGSATSQSSILITQIQSALRTISELFIVGVSDSVAGAPIPVDIRTASGMGENSGLRGAWTAGSAIQVSTMTFLVAAGTMTGTILIYGRTDL